MEDLWGFKRGVVAVGLLGVAAGCPPGDGSTGTETGSTEDTGGMTTPGATTSDTPTTSGTDTTGATSTTGVDTGTTGEDTGTTGEDTGTTGEDTETTGSSEVPAGCVAYADKIVECYMDPRAGMMALASCGELYGVYSGADYGPACGMAFEAYMVCLSMLPCGDLMGEEPTCEPEIEAMDTACGFL